MNTIKINIYSAIIMYIPHVLSHWCILLVEGESFKLVLADRVCPAAESSSVHRIDNAPCRIAANGSCSTTVGSMSISSQRLLVCRLFLQGMPVSSTATNGQLRYSLILQENTINKVPFQYTLLTYLQL